MCAVSRFPLNYLIAVVVVPCRKIAEAHVNPGRISRLRELLSPRKGRAKPSRRGRAEAAPTLDTGPKFINKKLRAFVLLESGFSSGGKLGFYRKVNSCFVRGRGRSVLVGGYCKVISPGIFYFNLV